jgi:hypothetical protein
MSGVAGRSGRKAFVPDSEQRHIVKTLTGLGLPRKHICRLVTNPQTGTGNRDALVYFLFDLLHLDGEAVSAKPVKERKERLRELLSNASSPLQFSDHQIGRGRAFYMSRRVG